MSNCPCGTGVPFAQCCEPYLTGRAKPTTAEKLLRSRYAAFTVGNVEYVEQTIDPAERASFDRADTTDWAKNSEWLGLEIVRTEKGQAEDSRGEVEFIARYRREGTDRTHHERAEFRKREGQWYFVDGRPVAKPYRAPEKPGRNDPCPCGSGKKYKKCHGAAA